MRELTFNVISNTVRVWGKADTLLGNAKVHAEIVEYQIQAQTQ